MAENFSKEAGYNLFGRKAGDVLKSVDIGLQEYERLVKSGVPKEQALLISAIKGGFEFAEEKLLGYGSKWLGDQIIGNIGRIDKSGENHIIKIDMQFFAERDLPNQNSNSLRRGISKLEKEIELHRDKLQNPKKYELNWENMSEVAQKGLLKHWKKEISNFYESIQNRIEELRKRGEWND